MIHTSTSQGTSNFVGSLNLEFSQAHLLISGSKEVRNALYHTLQITTPFKYQNEDHTKDIKFLCLGKTRDVQRNCPTLLMKAATNFYIFSIYSFTYRNVRITLVRSTSIP